MIERSGNVDVQIAWAFVDGESGGNPAGVVIGREDLTPHQMGLIAARVGLSETAFARAVPEGFFIDFFTPTTRVADCGHATIAAFHVLHESGTVRDGETNKFIVNGRRPMRVADGLIWMTQPYATLSQTEDPGIAMALSIAERRISNVVRAAHDTAMLLVNVESADDLRSIRPNFEVIESLSVKHDVLALYVFEASNPLEISARVFAPAVGIPEESATGTAAGLLAAHLHNESGGRNGAFRIHQGAYMPRPSPSLLLAKVSHDADELVVWVGGRGKNADRFSISL